MIYRAIIFDFFGVVGQSTYQLVGEDYTYTEAQNAQLHDLHKAFDNGFVGDQEFLQTYARIIGLPYEKFIKKYYTSEQRFRNSYAVFALVESLKKDYKVGLLSNVGQDAYTKFIEPIVHHFDEVVTSYDAQLAKPERAIFELMAHKLGVDVSECIMIDDSESNCEGARAAGMQAICFTTLDNLKQTLRIYLIQ